MKKETLYQAVIDQLAEMGMEPKAVEVAKLNDEILHGVTVKLKAATKTVDGEEYEIAPTVYLEQCIDDHLLDLLHEDHLPEAAKNIAHQMASCFANSEVYKGPEPTAQGLENCPFVLALCDRDLNKKFLSDKPYLDVGNGFALFLRIKIRENRDRFYTVNVTDSRLEMLNLTKEEAFEKAFAEAECSDTMLCAMPEVLQSIAGEEPTNLLNEMGVGGISSPEEEEMFLLTDSLYGAAALYRPGMKEKVAEILNDDFYVLPSSVHEFILMPAGNNPCSERELGMLVEDANKYLVDHSELLSYKVQKFSRKLGKLISCMQVPRFS